jgi:methionine-rich copper-binding protein CopC
METTMSRSPSMVGLALASLLLAPAAVLAHAELVSTSPEDGATLDEPPTEVVLVFDGELDPEASGFVVTDAGGDEVGRGEVDLTVAERNEMRGGVETEAGGEYTVSWSAAAADGHMEEGAATFTVRDADGDTAGAPDTATSRPLATSPMTILGLALLLVAARLARARLSSRPEVDR